MRFSKIITCILFISILFAQADKGGEQSRSIPKKFKDGFILEPVKNHPQFQTQFNSDEIVHVPGYSHRYNYSRNNRSVDDTLAYDTDWNAQFVMSPGDLMMTVIQMPTDATIKGINVPIYSWGSGEELTVSLHRVSYPFGSDSTMYNQSLVDADGWLAGYDDNGDGLLELEGTTWSISNGVCTGDNMINNATDPLGWEHASGPSGTPTMGLLWPDDTVSATLDPINNPGFDNGGGDNWINLESYGSEIDLLSGEWVGIAVRYSGSGGDGSDPQIGFFYQYYYFGSPWVSTKFYADTCSGTGGENGWYIRSWVFNFQLAVELTGDRGPVFESISYLPTTLSTEDRTVTAHITDDNPSGGDAGVSSAQIIFQIDSLTAPLDTIEMILISGNEEDGVWEGDIPGQSFSSYVYWKLRAVDVNGNVTEEDPVFYYIFSPSSYQLVYLNQEYEYTFFPPIWPSIIDLYIHMENRDFDFWPASFGPLTSELLQYYNVLIELTGGSEPIYYNDEEVSNWMAYNKIYIVAGDDWLGGRYGYPGPDSPVTIPDSEVARAILGIETYYSDINYNVSGDQHGISRLMPDSDGAASILTEFLSDSLLLNYDPQYETGNNNWLDGFEVVDGYTVDMTAFSGVLDTNGNVSDGAEIYNVMTHSEYVEDFGGKSAFLAFDPIALNTLPSYYWVGASGYWNTVVPNYPYNTSPLISVYEVLTEIESVDEYGDFPNAFSLKGNYPNPFNPVTNIHYELPVNTQVKITIYDLLGRKVKTLLNAQQTAGEKIIQWDSRNDLGLPVSAGVYLYKVEVRDLVETRKMVLLK